MGGVVIEIMSENINAQIPFFELDLIIVANAIRLSG